MIEPAVEAAKNDKLYAYRVNKVVTLHKLAITISEGHRLHEIIDTLRSQGKFDEASKELEKARTHTDKVMDMFYAVANMNEGLIDKNEVGGFIKLVIKGWMDDEAKKITAKEK